MSNRISSRFLPEHPGIEWPRPAHTSGEHARNPFSDEDSPTREDGQDSVDEDGRELMPRTDDKTRELQGKIEEREATTAFAAGVFA